MFSPEINESIQTVLDIGSHFDRLKDRATLFLENFGASDRGFFTPTEDDQLRQLLVSYWHSRNALFEVVLGNRDYDEATSDEEKHVRFLIGFGGALVLIDAARFMIDHVHDRPTVRTKLNEPEPAFGIPSGVYDRIRKSLTNPVHAWHLYHALQFVDNHDQSLQRYAASNEPLRKLLELSLTLRHRLNVGLDDYLIARIRARATELVTHVRRDLLFRAMYGIQKFCSQLLSETSTQPGHKSHLPSPIAEQLRSQLIPGDVLITRHEYAMTNYFLPGFWPHAALYLGCESHMADMNLTSNATFLPLLPSFRNCGSASEGRVLEALKDGVRLRPVSTPMTCDAIAVVRPQLTIAQVTDSLARGLHFVGRPYDFDFDFTRSDRLVCTEVVYRTYEGIGGLGFPLVRRAERLTLSAEDLLRMAMQGDGFRVVGAFAPGFATEFQLADDATGLLNETLPKK